MDDEQFWTFDTHRPEGQARLDRLAAWVAKTMRRISFWKGDERDRHGVLPLGIECPSCGHLDVYAEGPLVDGVFERGVRCTDCMWSA